MDYNDDPMREVERDNLAAEEERERREAEERVGTENHSHEYDIEHAWGILAAGYLLAFAIVCLVQATKK